MLTGILAALDRASVAPADIGIVIHGTTLATNALIERRARAPRCITTAGLSRHHRDAAREPLRAVRSEPRAAAAAGAAQLRLPVAERIARRGEILRAARPSARSLVPSNSLESDGYRERGSRASSHATPTPCMSGGYGSCWPAPCQAYRSRSPARSRRKCANTSASTRSAPTLTCKPLIAGYLAGSETRLRAEGLACPAVLMISGGGIITLETALRLSHSSGGIRAGGWRDLRAAYRRAVRREPVLSFDMGGTTAKICLDRRLPAANRARLRGRPVLPLSEGQRHAGLASR